MKEANEVENDQKDLNVDWKVRGKVPFKLCPE